jgi:hypothetical protein
LAAWIVLTSAGGAGVLLVAGVAALLRRRRAVSLFGSVAALATAIAAGRTPSANASRARPRGGRDARSSSTIRDQAAGRPLSSARTSAAIVWVDCTSWAMSGSWFICSTTLGSRETLGDRAGELGLMFQRVDAGDDAASAVSEEEDR